MTRQAQGQAPSAKQLRQTAEAIEYRARATIDAIEDMNATLQLLNGLSESCRERASSMDGKPHDTPSSKTGPKREAFTI
jgi:hypothetical protein